MMRLKSGGIFMGAPVDLAEEAELAGALLSVYLDKFRLGAKQRQVPVHRDTRPDPWMGVAAWLSQDPLAREVLAGMVAERGRFW